MIITNSRYALVGYFTTSYPTQAHGIIVMYLRYVKIKCKAVLNEHLLQVSDPPTFSTLQTKSIIPFYIFYIVYLSKESLKSVSIISTENETDTRIYGTICVIHKKDKRGKVFEATRPYYDVLRLKKKKGVSSG